MTDPHMTACSKRVTKAQLRQAILQAELALKCIGHPEPLSPPDATLCRIMAQGALVRMENALK
mgnify:CR=1 FL=1